jgi:hypothetical protein
MYDKLSICKEAAIWLHMLAIGYKRHNSSLTLSLQCLLPCYYSYSRLTSKHKGLGFLGSPIGGGIRGRGFVGKDL